MAKQPITGQPSDGTTAADDPDDAERRKIFDEIASRHKDGTPGSPASLTGEGRAAEDEDRDELEDLGNGGTSTGDEDEGQPSSDAGTVATAADEAAQHADIWANAPPALKAAFEAQQAVLTATKASEEELRGRIAGQTRKVNELTEQLTKPASGAAAAASTAAEVTEAKKLLEDPDFKKAAEEYPEVYKPLVKAMTGMIDSFESKLSKELDPLRTHAKTANERLIDDDLARQGPEIQRLDSTYFDAVRDPMFHGQFSTWLGKQPEEIQAMAANATIVRGDQTFVKDAAKTVKVFQMFKADTKYGAPARQAPAGDGKGKKPAGESSTRSDSVRRQLQLDAAVETPEGGAAPVAGDANSYEANWKQYAEKARKRHQEYGVL